MEKLILNVIADIQNLNNSLQVLANTLASNELSNVEVDTKKEVCLEEVRAVLATKSKDGKTSAVKELLTSFGADKLSDVKPEQYAKLLEKAEVL